MTSYDLSPDQAWDIVPLSGIDAAAHVTIRRQHIGAINNGYWFCHRAHASAARLAHGTVYAMDAELGPVDISVFGSILLHLRDPFLALHNAARLTTQTMIVADILPGAHPLVAMDQPLAWPRSAVQAALRPKRSVGDLVEPAAEARWWNFSANSRLRKDAW